MIAAAPLIEVSNSTRIGGRANATIDASARASAAAIATSARLRPAIGRRAYGPLVAQLVMENRELGRGRRDAVAVRAPVRGAQVDLARTLDRLAQQLGDLGLGLLVKLQRRTQHDARRLVE